MKGLMFMETSIFEQYESEVRSYCRNFPAVFAKAKDAIITDENGKEYIDFFCGAGALNYGHNNDYIKNKVIDYLTKI
jgi:diaminobutyrate-2-oxoglutarate transaminase